MELRGNSQEAERILLLVYWSYIFIEMANYPHNDDDVLLSAFYRLIILQLATNVHSNQLNSAPLSTFM